MGQCPCHPFLHMDIRWSAGGEVVIPDVAAHAHTCALHSLLWIMPVIDHFHEDQRRYKRCFDGVHTCAASACDEGSMHTRGKIRRNAHAECSVRIPSQGRLQVIEDGTE
jgi:hypothetical protein